MKSQVTVDEVSIMKALLFDCLHASTTQSVKRDVEVLTSRVKHEGLSFLTITLPKFGDEFFQSLELGEIGPTFFRSFKKNGRIPAFLQGMVGQVFDRQTGKLHDAPNVEAIACVRQITYTFKKLLLPCTPERVAKAMEGYCEVEQDLRCFVTPEGITDFETISNLLWSRLDYGFNSYELVPKHGPGATCEHISGNQKYNHRFWYKRVDQYFPFHHFAYANEKDEEGLEVCTFVPEEDEEPVRVISVPKTLKTPRIIAIEPVCMQYTQQAVARYLIPRIENHSIVGGQINFSDQSINRDIAMNASIKRTMATIDLSSASDRVPLSLIKRMLKEAPNLLDAIIACRSKRANVQGEVIRLKKFASMGSALCFPVEAMYFYTICVLGLIRARKLTVDIEGVLCCARDVYVYGDDIAVPVDCVEVVMQTLHEYNCKVNTNKSFWKSFFRESCGLDAFDGEDITPIYVRHRAPTSLRSASAIAAWTATSNLMHLKGYWKTADLLKLGVEKAAGIKMPVVGQCCAGLGWRSFTSRLVPENGRWNKTLQRHEVKTLTVSTKSVDDKLHSASARLMKSLLSLENTLSELGRDMRPEADRVDERVGWSAHYLKTKRRGAVALKHRWVQPY